MAKLTNKYDVVQMGDTPDFMSGVYDVLEKYLDPEYQMRRRAEKEEQRRYENERAVEADRYNKEFDFKLNEYNDAKERQDRIDKKNALTDLNNEFYSNITIMRESGASAEDMVDFISGYKNESTVYGDNISIDKIDPIANSYMDKAQFINNANNFLANPTQEDYNSLITQMGDNPNNINYFNNRVKPEYEKFVNEKQSQEAIGILGNYFNVDNSLISSVKNLKDGKGVETLSTIIDFKTNQQNLSNKNKRALANELIQLQPEETASDAQIQKIAALNNLGYNMLLKLGDLGSVENDEENKSGKISFGKFNPRTIKDNARVLVNDEELTGREFKQKYGQANFTEENLKNIQVFDPTKTAETQVAGFGKGRGMRTVRKTSPSIQSRKIPTKQEVDRVARELGFTEDKFPKGSIQYMQLLVKLRKRFPSYDFGS